MKNPKQPVNRKNVKAQKPRDKRRLSKSEIEERRHRERMKWTKLALVPAAIIAIAAAANYLRPTTKPANPLPAPSNTSTQPTPTPETTSTDSTDLGNEVSLGCPAPPGHRGLSPLRIRVVGWCAFPGVRGQAQFKLKVWVQNTGNRVLDVSLEHWYVLVGDLNPRDWSPPEIGEQLDARPFRVRYKGERVWAIPANPERAYDAIPGQPGVGTFATHWLGTQVPTKESFRPPLSDKTRGVLVFYMPKPSAGSVIGVAFMKNQRVVAVSPQENWGPRLAALDF